MLMRDIVLLCCVALVFGFGVYIYKINKVTATPLRDQSVPLSHTIDKKSCPTAALTKMLAKMEESVKEVNCTGRIE